MRSRNIKPGLFKNEKLAECSFPARLFFIGLWCYADKKGLCEYRPQRMKIEILPYDKSKPEDLIKELISTGFIKQYQCNGTKYLKIVNFTKHQRPHNTEKESTFPDISKQNTLDNGENTLDNALIPDSLIPERGIMKDTSPSKKKTLEDVRNEIPINRDLHLATILADLMTDNNPTRKDTPVPQLYLWANEVRLMRERDNRTYEEIIEIIHFSQQDNFWKGNILSMGKLRKQFDQLNLKRKSSRYGK